MFFNVAGIDVQGGEGCKGVNTPTLKKMFGALGTIVYFECKVFHKKIYRMVGGGIITL